jgi:hypothetical protein
MISNIVGNTVQGEDFFDRERELASVLDRLETDNVLLLAPRRVGKTSLMYRIQEKEKKLGRLAAYLSVADVNSELQFVQKLYEAAQRWSPGKSAIKKLAGGPLGRFMKRIKKLGVAVVSIELADNAADQWAELGAALARVLDALDQRCVFLVDELPIFILSLLRQEPTGARARTFLNWFRQLRQDPESSRRVRWLLAGSIGLDTVTQRLRLGDTINDLFLFNELGPFSPEIADAFLTELGKSYGIHLPSSVKAHVRSRLGWLIPYHLQIFFSKLRERGDGKAAGRITTADVDAVYEALLTPAGKGYFDYWEQRLAEELGTPDDRQALDLLNAVAKNPDGEPLEILRSVLGARLSDPEQRDRQLRFLLDVLRSDGYLVLEGERYRFRSALLRDFWTRRILP